MMKKFLFIFVFMLLLFPVGTMALSDIDSYETTNLKETLESYDIELKNKNYKENDDQVVVYLFRSSGCQYTSSLLNYFNSISDTHGKYFRLVSFEVDGNKDNMQLFQDVADFLDLEQRGVPFFIIGEEHKLGYNEEEKDLIGRMIKDEYNKKNRYDIFEAMEKDGWDLDADIDDETEEEVEDVKKEKKFQMPATFTSIVLPIIFSILIIVVSVVVILVSIGKKMSCLNKDLEFIEKKLKNKEK